LGKPSSRRYYPYGDISHERALTSLHAFLLVLRQAQSPEQLDQMIRERFDVYMSVGCDDQGTVLYTGYYCPIFDGRKQRDNVFRYPLYRSPPDLIRDAEGNTQGRRLADGRIVPYATRRELEEQRQLEGTEIAWLKSPFEAYVVSVQGSAKLRLADGSLWELGYAGNNGHEYRPIAEPMIADGVLKKSDLSLQTLLRYFQEHPEQVEKYVWQNPRYIFFKETSGGPYGSIGVPVTRFRSLATDKTIFPRACLAFIDTNLPQHTPGGVTVRPHAEFALDQDTGGAIRAAGRCDVYMGVGPDAEALAGRTYAEGDLYYIFLKDGGRAAPPR
jgi:membrane-bound lytic murein transglycosylase A